MKITHAKPVLPREPSPKNVRTPDAAASDAVALERVSVSVGARERMKVDLDRVRAIVEQTPDVREDKVAQVREAIAKGTYAPPTEAVADTMVRASLLDSLVRK
jgi:flagellar biosynthesis anti-sigma factor FlgM